MPLPVLIIALLAIPYALGAALVLRDRGRPGLTALLALAGYAIGAGLVVWWMG